MEAFVTTTLKKGIALGLLVGGFWAGTALAQSDMPRLSDADRAKLTDAERVQRDANRVLSLIKFHAVRQSAPPSTPPVAVVSAKPAVPPIRPAASLVAAAPQPPHSAPSKPVEAAPQTSLLASAGAATEEPRTLPPVSPDPLPTPAVQAPEPAPAEPAPAPPVEEEDTTIKLVKYVVPELTQRAISSVSTASAVVRVRFTVMPDGTVSKTSVVGADVPRALGQVATKAVAQWRFEPIKEARDVEVGVDFRFE